MEPLAKIENYLCPQLDYIKKDWDPAIVQQFIDRYNNGHVKQQDKVREYNGITPIQDTLKAYSLDPERFWYFVLFAADYANGLGSFYTPNPSPIEELDLAFNLIAANLQPHPFPTEGGYLFMDDPNMKLTLTVKKPGRKRSTVVDIKTPNALGLLAELYRKADKSNPLFHQSVGGTMDRLTVQPVERLACFYIIMMSFLKPQVPNKGVTKTISKDKVFFTSRVAQMIGLTPPTKSKDGLDPFLDADYRNYLRDYVKDYLDINIYGLNEHYSFDYLF